MKIKVKNVLLVLFCILFFLSFWAPATNASTLSGPQFKMITRILYFILPFLCLLIMCLTNEIKYSEVSILIAITVIFNCLLRKIYLYGNESGGSVSSMLSCIIFCFTTNSFKKEFYKISKVIILLVSIFTLICFAFYEFNLPIPYKIVDYYATSKHGVWYIDYGVSYFYKNSVQIRACGLFNEPGWYGTILAFFLCIEGLNLRKWDNIILVLAGILTFSLAFFVIILVYYIFDNIQSPRKWISLVMMLIFIAFVLPQLTTGNKAIDSLIERVVNFTTSNNRTTEKFDIAFSKEIKNNLLLFGRGYGYSNSLGGGNLSIKTDILDFGFIGAISIFLPIIYILFKRCCANSNAKLFLLCVAISLIQRPWLFEVSNFMLTLAGISILSTNEVPKRIYKYLI